MAHHIHENDNMLSVGKAPWHGLGVTMQTAPASAQEALTIAGLDWQVSKQPMFLASGRGNAGLPNWWTAYNGVTEFVCHQAGRTQERRVSESWWGAGKDLSARALATALVMSGVC